MKVITQIGAVVEVEESVYNANKAILTPYTESKSEEVVVSIKPITAKETKRK